MDMLFLRLPQQAGSDLQAVSCVQGHWQRLGAWQNLDEMSAWTASRQLPVVLVTPAGLDIALTLDATPRQRREAGSSLVALAEEQLAEDYEHLHWSLDSIDELHVLARGIRLEWLQGWLRLLRDKGLDIKAAIPEAALLTADHDSWVWLPSGGDEVFIQTEPGQAALVSRQDAPFLLEQLLARRQMKTPVRLRHPQGITLPALPEGLHSSPAPWQDWADLLKTHSPLIWLRHPQNWLTGVLTTRPRQPWSSWWRAAIAASLVAVCLQVVLDRYEARQLRQQAASARSEAEQIYRQWFPEDRRIVNLRNQFQARLAAAGGLPPAQLLQVLAQTAPTPQWQVQKLDYRDGGDTTIEVIGGSLGEAQTWVSNLGSQGLQASLQNSRLEGGQARARIILTAAQAGR